MQVGFGRSRIELDHAWLCVRPHLVWFRADSGRCRPNSGRLRPRGGRCVNSTRSGSAWGRSRPSGGRFRPNSGSVGLRAAWDKRGCVVDQCRSCFGQSSTGSAKFACFTDFAGFFLRPTPSPDMGPRDGANLPMLQMSGRSTPTTSGVDPPSPPCRSLGGVRPLLRAVAGAQG